VSRKALKYKPLVEAILELRWRLPDAASPGIESDPHYRLLLGRISERVQGEYPYHEPLPTTQVPDSMVPHMAQHRFRASVAGWPLIQIGPGLMTVNETDGYAWDSFRARCVRAVDCLWNAHPARHALIVQDLTLRYIDAVEVEPARDSVLEFLSANMRTSIALPDALFEDGRVDRNPAAFSWQASFPHGDPGGLVTLRFAMGSQRGRPALIWETLVQAASDRIPSMPDQFAAWVERAHDLADDWFFKLIEGDLERRFSGE